MMNLVCADREPYKNNEDFYNHMVKYFSREGAVLAYDDDSRQCLYRANVGGKLVGCAIGCGIPDSMYDYEMAEGIEQTCASEAMSRDIRLQKMFANVGGQFANEMQHYHDNAPDVETFLSQAKKHVEYYGFGNERVNS